MKVLVEERLTNVDRDKANPERWGNTQRLAVRRAVNYPRAR